MTIIFGIVCVIIKLAVEAYREHKANEYANQAKSHILMSSIIYR